MMVFQHYGLLPWLTVRENIRLAVDEVLQNLGRADKISLVNEHLAMVNLTSAVDNYPDKILSVLFSHPRDRQELRESKEYYELRNYALNFLDRYFTQDE